MPDHGGPFLSGGWGRVTVSDEWIGPRQRNVMADCTYTGKESQ